MESLRERYRQFAIRYGLQYYAAGRFATENRFTPVCANLLHHAVELLLKACLSYDDSVEAIEKYSQRYRHNIRRLWDEFKKRQPAPVPVEFDAIIAALHDFEDIRYPDKLIRNGAMIMINVVNAVVDEPIRANGQEPERSYNLTLPQIHRLVGLLFKASKGNPEVFLPEITDEQGNQMIVW